MIWSKGREDGLDGEVREEDLAMRILKPVAPMLSILIEQSRRTLPNPANT